MFLKSVFSGLLVSLLLSGSEAGSITAIVDKFVTDGAVTAAAFNGDGGPASSAQVNNPIGLWMNSVDNDLYFGDKDNAKIRKVSLSSTIISTTAGGVTSGSLGGGDGGPALSSNVVWKPWYITGDSTGVIYVIDQDNSRVRKIAANGIISTYAGVGGNSNTANTAASILANGDEGAATAATYRMLSGGAVDTQGNLYLADGNNNKVRMVERSTGLSKLVAGTGQIFVTATDSSITTLTASGFTRPFQVFVDSSANLYFTAYSTGQCRKTALGSGTFVIFTGMIGSTSGSSSGNGGPVTAAGFGNTLRVAIDTYGNIFLSSSNAVRWVDNETMKVNQLASVPTNSGYSGNGGAASSARFRILNDILVKDNVIYVTDSNNAVRKITYNYVGSTVTSGSPTTLPSVQPSVLPSATPAIAPTVVPSMVPTVLPSVTPSVLPSVMPSVQPSVMPSLQPSVIPTVQPSVMPTYSTAAPSVIPTITPTAAPTTTQPTQLPTVAPTVTPTVVPTVQPSVQPSLTPTVAPSLLPTVAPTVTPTVVPTVQPSAQPSVTPTVAPSLLPTVIPTVAPSIMPTVVPTVQPSVTPTVTPTVAPSVQPSIVPSQVPTIVPTIVPTVMPTVIPTTAPSVAPSIVPTIVPTVVPTEQPTVVPTVEPSIAPSEVPTIRPTRTPTVKPTKKPTVAPSVAPTVAPSETPTQEPSVSPSIAPSALPTTIAPSVRPTAPTLTPTKRPTVKPTRQNLPSVAPTVLPSATPTLDFVDISFDSDIYLHNVTATVLGETEQSAVEEAVAQTLLVNSSQVTFLSQELIGEEGDQRKKLRRLTGVVPSYQIRVSVNVWASTRDFPDATNQDGDYLYNMLSTTLTTAVDTNAFTATVRSVSAEINAVSIRYVGYVNLTVTEYSVVTPPTPAGSSKHHHRHGHLSTGDFAGIVIGVLMAAVLLVVGWYYGTTIATMK